MAHPLLNTNRPVIGITIDHEGQRLKFSGRTAWMLAHLLVRGEKGASTLDTPGARMSQYVMLLRRAGIIIETAMQEHGGAFAGQHGVYILRSPVTVVAVEHPEEGRNAA